MRISIERRSWGDLSPWRGSKQLRQLFHRNVVADLGAGNLYLAHYLLKYFRPSHVLAVEKEDRLTYTRSRRITVFNETFEAFSKRDLTWDIVFLSYPANHPLGGLLDLLERSPTVVVLSRNFDGTETGWPGMWRYLAKREVKFYDPNPSNSLTVYGTDRVVRPMTPDEVAGIDLDRIYTHPSRQR